ncbi:MAG TPA: exopolyphosphatase, partial [Burkholderiaceae bacterium]
TVGAVADILAASGITDGSITTEALRWCIRQCLAAGHVDKLDLPGLKNDRRSVVGGGLCILYTLLTQFGIERLQPARGALRQGVIFDLVVRREAERGQPARDLRERSVAVLQSRFKVDAAQARRVRDLALRLYEQLQPAAPAELQRELGWAAALHEIGTMVSHHDHHRHSAYLLAHVDAPGFSENQLQRLGQLALGQRGGLRKLQAELAADRALLWQLMALRLAVIQCHGRAPVDTQALRLRPGPEGVRVECAAGWAEREPRAHFLLGEELQAWARLGLVALAF